MLLSQSVFGIKLEIVIVILLLLIIFLGFILVLTIRKLNYVSDKYRVIMSGKKGKDLEKVILTRFKEMDKVKANAKKLNKEHKEIKYKSSQCISKIGLVKYDAFNDLTGTLSYAIALLDDENTGVVINSMYTKQGCFTYAKEIIKGESYIALSDEEKKAITKATTVDEEIDMLINQPEEDFETGEDVTNLNDEILKDDII